MNKSFYIFVKLLLWLILVYVIYLLGAWLFQSDADCQVLYTKSTIARNTKRKGVNVNGHYLFMLPYLFKIEDGRLIEFDYYDGIEESSSSKGYLFSDQTPIKYDYYSQDVIDSNLYYIYNRIDSVVILGDLCGSLSYQNYPCRLSGIFRFSQNYSHIPNRSFDPCLSSGVYRLGALQLNNIVSAALCKDLSFVGEYPGQDKAIIICMIYSGGKVRKEVVETYFFHMDILIRMIKYMIAIGEVELVR